MRERNSLFLQTNSKSKSKAALPNSPAGEALSSDSREHGRRLTWQMVLRRAVLASTIAVLALAGVSLYVTKYGWKSCHDKDPDVLFSFEKVCTQSEFYLWTAQKSHALTTEYGMKGWQQNLQETFWYVNGQIQYTGQFDAEGKKDGLWREWYFDGTPMFEGTYRNGVLQDEKWWNSVGEIDIIRRL